MPNLNHRDPESDLVNALDRHWDALLEGAAGDPDFEQLDPVLATATRRIHGLDTTPFPHPAFASALWEDLLQTQASHQGLTRGPLIPLRDHSFPVAGWRSAEAPRSFSRLAAAILLLFLLAGSAFVALYPLRQHERGELPLVAPFGTPTVEPVPETQTTLLNLTLTDIPPYRTEGGIAITHYPPGGSSKELAARTTEVAFIAVGPMTLRAVEAPEPIRVVPPGATAVEPTSRLLAAGEEMTVETGTTIVAPPEAVFDLINDGSTPTTMLDLLWASLSRSTEAGGAVWTKSGEKSLDLSVPVSVVVREESLAAGETLSAPDSDEIAQASVNVDPERLADLRSFTDGSVLNGGDEPMALYVLTVTNNAETPTPGVDDEKVQETPHLEFLWRSMGGPEPLSESYGVGVDPEGNVWVADRHDRFTIIAPDGTFIETWGTPGSSEGEFEFMCNCGSAARGYGDVAFDAEGNIYVADTGNRRVQKFAPDRTFLRAWGSEGEEDGQFLNPSGIAFDSGGTVYVSDEVRNDVQMFDTDGQFLGTIGEPGEEKGQFSFPAGVDVGPDGTVWVADYSNQRIQRFEPSGEFLGAWGEFGGGDGELSNPNDVAVDGLGRVYVADDANHRLQVFEPDGRFLSQFGGFGGEPGTFNDALGVAIGPDGTAYVSGRNGLQAFRLVP